MGAQSKGFEEAYRSMGYEPSDNGHHPDDNDVEVVCAAEVTLKAVRWFWRRRIPFGKLTIFDGDPDLGKSVVTVDIAARGTTGRTFPDGEPCEIANVLIVNIEDAADDTVVPRLKAAGADLNRVYLFSSIPDGKGGTRLLSIPEDVPLLERLIRQRSIKLVIIDPILTMLSGDANKDQDARRALAPVRDMAERAGVAIVAVRHLNKSVGLKAIQRGGGNMGLIGVARAGAFFAEYPDEQGLKVMAPHKSNLAEKPPSLGYRIVGNIDGVPRVEWVGVVEHDANTLAADASTPHERTQLDEAKKFLRDELKDAPVWVKQVYKDAKDAGISDRTLQRAKMTLRVRSEKMGVDGWMWSLPPEELEDDHQEQIGDVGDVGDVQESNERSSANSLYIKEGRQGRQERQGRQGCQEEDSLSDVPLGGGEAVCIHDTPGGCWLCRGEKA
jgi:putative DNA primase/helicase